MENDINHLTDIEKPVYIYFHEWVYKDSFELANYLKEKNPRWAIIIGYYAMHEITKLYLGKIHNIKINPPEVHKKAINALSYVLKSENTRAKIIQELEKAREKYEIFSEGNEELLPLILKQGKSQREKHQYYQTRVTSVNIASNIIMSEAKKFLDNTVNPFIELIENLIKNA